MCFRNARTPIFQGTFQWLRLLVLVITNTLQSPRKMLFIITVHPCSFLPYLYNLSHRLTEVNIFFFFQKCYSSRSYGSFINLKLFDISWLTEKETEMCLCSKHLNSHCLYKAVRSAISTDLPASLLWKNMTCELEPDTDFHRRTCIFGQCNKSYKIVNISADLEKALPKAKIKKEHYCVQGFP